MAAVVKKISNAVKQNASRLSDLLGQYLPLNPGKINAALPRAQIAPQAEGDTQSVLRDYVQPGDSMTIAPKSNTRTPSHIVIGSSLDNQPISFSVGFAALSDGTYYPSATEMKWEARKLEIRITNFDYHKQ